VLGVNVVGTMALWGVLRLTVSTPHQGWVDISATLLGSTAHFWYSRTMSWKVKILVALVGADAISFAMLSFVTGVLRDGT
jgi:hypothetical protein